MKFKVQTSLFIAALLLSPQLFAKAVLVDASAVKYLDVPGFKGVSMATVEGDSAKGPHHSFIKFAAGFESPVHFHSANHFAAVVTGNLTLKVDGKEHKLAPGSFFSFTDKSVHSTKCEADADCLIFLDARSKWDVIPEKSRVTSLSHQ